MSKINWSLATSHDDVKAVEDNIRGCIVLLDGLASFTYQNDSDDLYKSFDCINNSLYKTIKDLKQIRDGVDYMQDLIRNSKDD